MIQFDCLVQEMPLIKNGNRTEWSPIWKTAKHECDIYRLNRTTHILLPIKHNNYNFPQK